MNFRMSQKISWFRFFAITTIFSFGFILTSCNGEKGNQTEDVIYDDVVDDDVIESINEAKKIFYALPSPLETAMLIKTSGAKYDEELLNSVDNADDYSTNKSMALNLGIYITDLSFASLFDQTQTTITYMSSAKKIADRLGILDAIDNETIEKLEENINNREVIMDIISETFMSSSSFLQENDRAAVSSVMLVGGWIEGLYIATQLVDQNASLEDNRLVDRIIDQKLSYGIVVKLMNQNKENPDVQSLMEDIKSLEKIFNKIDISTSEQVEVVKDESGSDYIKSDSKSHISPEVFTELSDKVSEIRLKFIK